MRFLAISFIASVSLLAPRPLQAGAAQLFSCQMHIMHPRKNAIVSSLSTFHGLDPSTVALRGSAQDAFTCVAQHACLVYYIYIYIYIYIYLIYIYIFFHSVDSVGMSHSSLAEQWEQVASIRDRARRLELATCHIT